MLDHRRGFYFYPRPSRGDSFAQAAMKWRVTATLGDSVRAYGVIALITLRTGCIG